MTDDGLLDYTIIPKMGLGKIVREIPRLYNGNLNESKYVLGGKCRILQVVPMDEHSEDIVELDGEIEGRLPLTLEVTGRKINVVAGSSTV